MRREEEKRLSSVSIPPHARCQAGRQAASSAIPLGPGLGLMLYCHQLEILNFGTRGSTVSLFTGPRKFCSQSCWAFWVCSIRPHTSPRTFRPLPHLSRWRTWMKDWPKVPLQSQDLDACLFGWRDSELSSDSFALKQVVRGNPVFKETHLILGR